jgi:hypothetical protein
VAFAKTSGDSFGQCMRWGDPQWQYWSAGSVGALPKSLTIRIFLSGDRFSAGLEML